MSTGTPSDPVRVLFIGGWGRSGSTLLDRLLGMHREVVGVGELRDVWLRGPVEDRPCGCGRSFRDCPYWSRVGRVAFGGWERVDAIELAAQRPRLDRPWHLPLLLRPRTVRAYERQLSTYAAALGRLYRAIRDVAGARVVVDSSNIATSALLLRHVPGIDLRVLHLVRDSRGVVNSWSRPTARPAPGPSTTDHMPRYGVIAACLRYDGYNTLAGLLPRLGVPYLRVRYEELVTAPSLQLDRALAFAGVDPDPAIAAGTRVPLEPHHSVDGNPARLRTGPVDLRLDESWLRELPDGSRRATEVMTGPLLRRYGYLGRATR